MTLPSRSKPRFAPKASAPTSLHRPDAATASERRVRLHVDPSVFHLVARSGNEGDRDRGQARVDPRRWQSLRGAAVRAIRDTGRGASFFLLTFRYAEHALVLSSRSNSAGLDIWISPAPRGLTACCITEADAARRPSEARQQRLPRHRPRRW